MKLDDLLQISKQEFEDNKALFASVPCISQTGLTWTDDDGDGLGWVFCGGIVVKFEATKGTIELITGSEGDCGRKAPFDENFVLAQYINSASSPSRMGFVEYLKARINSKGKPEKHLLYGYDNKYQNKVTDEQFSRLIKEFSGYRLHKQSYGWGGMDICHSGHYTDGNSVYGTYGCYDSSNDHYTSWSDGIKTDCDICEGHTTGNEAYEAETWYRCKACHNLSEGQTVRCSGHSIYGREFLGNVYDTFTKKNGKYYRVKVEAEPAPGYTAIINCDKDQPVDWTYKHTVFGFTYQGTVTFKSDKTSRAVNCGFTMPYIDEEPPVVETITMTPQTSSNGWVTISQLDVSGTENYCDTVYLTITNKSSGKVILDNAAIQVTNKKYSYSTTPPLEGGEAGNVYTVSV